MTLKTTKTKIRLDGHWNLQELSEAMKDYIHLYGFTYSLLLNLPTARRAEVEYIYGKFPWRGGFSTVNFFSQLFSKIPPKLRPEIKRIRYASPGFIELQELSAAAVEIAKIVTAVCVSLNMAHGLYRKIQKGSVAHKLAKIDVASKELELTQRQLTFCTEQANNLIKLFNLSTGQIATLQERTQGNAVMKLKILLSVYRRVEPLATKQFEGKIQLTTETNEKT